jgi:putative transposase
VVRHPADYLWSSYRCNAQGEVNVLIKLHRLYKALGADESLRRAAYRQLFRHELDPELIDAIRSATNGNYALGSERFAKQVTAALGQRVTRGKAGRSRKELDDDSGDLFTWLR